MSAHALATGMLWALAALVILGAVGVAVVRRAAARVVVASVAVLLALVLLAAHLQVSALAGDHLPDLCRGAVRWFGLTLTGSAEACTRYR